MLIARKIIIGTYVCLTIVFLNFGIPILPNYQLTVAVIYPFVFFLLGRLRLTIKGLTIYFLAIIFPVFQMTVGYLSYGQADFTHFLKSYSLYLHFCFSLLIINNIEIDLKIMGAIDKAIIVSLSIVGTYTILQFAVFALFGEPFLFNLFGAYLIGGESDPSRFIIVDNVVRPSTFYWEPSVNALVILMEANYLMIRNINKFKRYYFPQIVLLFMTNSATGLFASGITLLTWVSTALKRRFLLLKIVAILFVLFGTIASIIDRLSFSVPGSSGWFRWVRPFELFIDYIQTYPLGLPLGQLEYKLDNGLFVAIIYTGMVGVAVAIVLLFKYVRLLIIDRITVETQLLFVSILMLLFFNGAFLTPEMSFLICLVTVAWRSRTPTGPAQATKW